MNAVAVTLLLSILKLRLLVRFSEIPPPARHCGPVDGSVFRYLSHARHCGPANDLVFRNLPRARHCGSADDSVFRNIRNSGPI